MTWPATPGFTTGNVDAAGDSPSAARADIKLAMDDLISVINGRGEASGVAPLDAGSKVPAANLPTISPFNGLVAFQTAGSGSWSVPAGVTRLYVEAWGAGGGGGFGATGGVHGGGGGSGGGAVKVWAVTPGGTVNYTVGGGGAGGIGPSDANGAAGGNTTVTIGATTITGTGGQGGIGNGGTAGQGGDVSGSSHDVAFAGSFGQGGVSGHGGIGGTNPRSGQGPAAAGRGFGGGSSGSGTGGPATGFQGRDGGVLIMY